MKKFLLIGLLAFAVILAGCSEKLSQDELFEKKQSCIAYKDNIQKEIDKEIQSFRNTDFLFIKNIEEIFYSIKENSCFALIGEMSDIDGDGEPYKINRIINLLTNEKVGYTDNQIVLYYERLKQLKGE